MYKLQHKKNNNLWLVVQRNSKATIVPCVTFRYTEDVFIFVFSQTEYNFSTNNHNFHAIDTRDE